ncbi:serine/threonine protein kinase [Exophiala xenobiotica]|uniref:Serine/threonine protein kinase n=1 Tax=Lithohypha guttulata TaxID=1690604 RepID=A0ABR0KBL3_9EURO|nr:serine/threonine protein kinase [Lithohypha guttulata]KAK5318394.1 serine/threonine protein kinase [Exophiala xenobiotica]
MPPKAEKSSLKRVRHSTGEDQEDIKKPRRSARLSQFHPDSTPKRTKKIKTPIGSKPYPSPITHAESTATIEKQDGTASPPNFKPTRNGDQVTPDSSPILTGLSSPPQDTQLLSQFVYPPRDLGDELEEDEGTWGFLIPVDPNVGHKLIMRRRAFCPAPIKPLELTRATTQSRKITKQDELRQAEEEYEKQKESEGFPAGGYLLGRHPECDVRLDFGTISNRHCLIFNENKPQGSMAVIEDLSSNGTFVNEAILGRNKRRDLEDGDEVALVDNASFIFRYPKTRLSSAFHSQYRILQQLGKGHFATVYLCVDRSTGHKFAVKKFERRMGDSQRSQTEGLQQEIAVLMSVSHPNVLCLKENYEEADGVYLVLELAAEGELFNWIVSKQKLSEAETRKVFIQLFQGVKYLHERNIVHRDIKPENILLTDKNLSVKLADFGLAKIIGEESFTTTLCGTPSYVAPEILENTKHRKYTRAVDVWSLGVVLYICLCGFPPFSDELYTPERPYTLAQQIKMGHFDYPSPYWDPVGDPALDLIDRMLTVDVEKRITIDECLEHPWTRDLSLADLQPHLNRTYINPEDSTNGLTGAIGSLKMDFSKRKIKRQRTLLANINDIKVSKVVEVPKTEIPAVPVRESSPATITIWEKNPQGKKKIQNTAAAKANGVAGKKGKKGNNKEEHPAENRQEEEFMSMGGKGDMPLFADDNNSRYIPAEVPPEAKEIGAK